MPNVTTTADVLSLMQAANFAAMRTLLDLEPGVDLVGLDADSRIIHATNAAASKPPASLTGTWFTGGTATTTKPQLLIEPTGTTSTGWSTSGTGLGVNAASGFTGRLLDLQLNGTTKFYVTSTGAVVGALTVSAAYLNSISSGTTVPSTGSIGWSSSANPAVTPDTTLYRDAANTLGLRNDGSAQTLNIYSDLGNPAGSYERLAISLDTSGNATLATATSGGTAGSLILAPGNAAVRWATGVTVSGLPGTPVVGMISRVTDATAPAIGSTVAGGGAAAALVWYNGAAWTVIGV